MGRCKLHGGASTGPRNKDGLARLTEAKIKHGKFTKEKRAEAKRRAEVGRQMRGELKELEEPSTLLNLIFTKRDPSTHERTLGRTRSKYVSFFRQ